jgi:hypothetical protein
MARSWAGNAESLGWRRPVAVGLVALLGWGMVVLGLGAYYVFGRAPQQTRTCPAAVPATSDAAIARSLESIDQELAQLLKPVGP